MVKTKLAIIVTVLFILGGTFAVSYKKMNTQTPPVSNPVVTGTVTTLPYGSATVKVGQQAVFLRNSITVTKVTEDSRCPDNVQCIQAGTVKIELQSVTELGTKTDILELGKEFSLGSEKVTFTGITPNAKAGVTVNPEEYVITLTVVPDTTTATTTAVTTTVSKGGCYVGGCSSETCSDKQDMMSNCMYRPEFACYKTAVCERQATGKCGWTDTPVLQACIRDAGAVDR